MSKYDEINKQLKKRSTAFIGSSTGDRCLFIHSPFDEGVVRNGGRRGAKYGPRAIQAQINKLAFHENKERFQTITISESHLNFSKEQKIQTNELTKAIRSFSGHIIHIGGGHDHIYQFVMSVRQKFKDKTIHIINLDAHLDTRLDEHKHSGTPFRQILNEDDNIKLTQLGIHPYANVPENYLDIQMKVYHMDELREKTNDFCDNQSFCDSIIDTNELTIISLDCDALCANDMSAVSAVNHDGLPIKFLRALIQSSFLSQDNCYFGIYEYNPIFDDLACSDARKLAALIYQDILN